MTRPQFTWQISLGNALQLLTIAIIGLGAWYAMSHQADTAAKGVTKNAADLVQIEVRVRALETRAAADSEQLRTLQRDISELKQGQRETNGLLRQLLQRGALE